MHSKKKETATPYAPRTVARFTDAIAAHIAKGRLEAEGITVFMANEHHVWANWLFSNALGGVELQVRQEDETTARQIIAQINSGHFADAESREEVATCPQCGAVTLQEEKGSRKVAFLSLFLLQLPLPFRRNRFVCEKCGHRQ